MKRYGKSGALLLFTCNLNIPILSETIIFTTNFPSPVPCIRLIRTSSSRSNGLYSFFKCGRHADAAILYGQLIASISFYNGRLFLQLYCNPAAFRCIFDGVGDQIGHDALEFGAIAFHLSVPRFCLYAVPLSLYF